MLWIWLDYTSTISFLRSLSNIMLDQLHTSNVFRTNNKCTIDLFDLPKQFSRPANHRGDKTNIRRLSIFLKIRSFFSFKFFQGHNWLTNYPDSEFHGHWKTVTLPSISPNLSKHWRFLAFWPSLCFGSCLLFLVCHYTAFLFSTRAMTSLGWLPNAHRDMISPVGLIIGFH